jgi:hypothetical protein
MGTQRDPSNPDASRPSPSRDYRPEQLGQEFDQGYNPHGYQRKEKVAAVAKCPTCQKELALVARTEEWEQRDDASWEHASWGPASGVCCDNLIVEFSEGYEVYPLPPRKTSRDPD